MDRPTLRQLEIFLAVAKIGTFRGAARELGLSQVAISDHIRQLEARLGHALFQRNAGGRPSLTSKGQLALDHSRAVLTASDTLIAAITGQPVNGSADRLDPVVMIVEAVETEKEIAFTPDENAVAMPSGDGENAPAQPLPNSGPTGDKKKKIKAPAGLVTGEAASMDRKQPVLEPEPVTPAAEILTIAGHPAILTRFQDKLAAAQDAFPEKEIAIDYRSFTADSVARAFAKSLVDIALFYGQGDDPRFPSQYLWSESWSLFTLASHPLAQVQSLTRSDCLYMPVIMPGPDNPLRSLQEQCMAAAGLWPSPTVLETDDLNSVGRELSHGEAVFAAFGTTASQMSARGDLRRLPLVEPLPSVEVRLALAPSARRDPVAVALADLLR